jgi:hypothetical protein
MRGTIGGRMADLDITWRWNPGFRLHIELSFPSPALQAALAIRLASPGRPMESAGWQPESATVSKGGTFEKEERLQFTP